MNRTRASVEKENRLVHQARAGSSVAFGELVRMFQDRLFNVVVQVTRCRPDAEDIVQDAFVQAYLKLDSFRHGSTFYTWLYRIAVNMAISNNHQRRQAVCLSLDQQRETDGIDPVDAGESPERRLLEAEAVSAIERALLALSDEHRVILLLRGVEGFDYEAIAEILELKPGTVRSRLHRARMQLRENLEKEQFSA